MDLQLAVFGVMQTQQTQHSWLVDADGAGRHQTKLPLNVRLRLLLLIWCWARNVANVDQGLPEWNYWIKS